MPVKRTAPIIVFIFLLSSCAGMFIRTDAQESFERGFAFFNQGKYKKAIPYFERATELDPDFADAYLYLGRSYLSLGKWLQSIPPLRAAFRLAPEKMHREALHVLLDALLGAALFEFRKGNFQASADYLREALTFDPQSAQAKDELSRTLIASGGASLSSGDIPAALTAFSEVAELSPGNIEAYIGLARAYLQSGQLLESLRALQKAAAIDPANSDAKELLRELMIR